MRYETIYDNLIEKRLRYVPEGYAEEHHIKPRSLGGSDTKDNLVRLTAREHYMAHYLLMKIQTPKSIEYYSMVKAFLMMQVQHESGLRYIPGHKFELLRKIDSERKALEYIGKGNSQYGTMWICNPTTKVNSKIKKTDDIPEGFIPGRNQFIKREKIIKSVSKIYFVKKEPFTIICSMCGKTFYSDNNNRKLCSHECSHKYMTGERVSKCLTEIQVVEIRKLLSENKTLRHIGDMFGVSYVAISKIKNNHTWKI